MLMNCIRSSPAKRILDVWKPFSSKAKMPGEAKKTYFRQVQSFKTDYAPTNITQYVSERTGMNVVVVDQKGPKVHGYFTLATEIFDNSGSPHTLEHLCFMGSKSYQYKGLLDRLATRAYSSTNAWTATDHTAYTLDTAGWEGFSQILPVYLEHLILPTLTEEACYTEVHHIDGDGNDAGVVYSEMQGIQNTGSDILDVRARQLLYPENVGFRYETGGLMENLRVLTTERIRKFHRDMYQPKNLCLVLIGEINQKELLEILDNFEAGIINDIPAPDAPFKRPWIDSPQPPALKESIVEVVHFPEEDESMGEIWIGMFGPDCKSSVDSSALNVILSYLAGSSASVLENVMVEKEELASSISYWWDARPNSVIYFQPTGVRTDKLAFVEKRLFELLKETASKPLDWAYLKQCLDRERRQCRFNAESSDSFYADSIINDFLFGHRDGSTLKDMESMAEFETLSTWTEEQWKDFLKKWISNAPHVSLLGTPSRALAKKLKDNEEARLAKRKEELGPEGLQEKAEKLKAAIAKNDAEIPASLLQTWPVPGVGSIHFHESITARSGLAKSLGTPKNEIQKLIDTQASDIPFFLQFEHVPTNFVHLYLHLGTSEVPTKHKPLLKLFIDNFFDTPILRDGKRIEFEQVVTELEEDTISYEMSGGNTIGNSDGLLIKFQIEPEKYAKAVEWIRTMMFDSIFDVTRLKAAVNKVLADIPDDKRDGSRMLYSVDAIVHLDDISAVKARTTIIKGAYMKRLKKLLAKDPEIIVSWLTALRKSIFTFSNMRALVIADVNKLPNPVKSWTPLISSLTPTDSLLPIVKQHTTLSPDGKNPGSRGAIIIPIPAIDSSFLLTNAPGPTSYTAAELPALKVALSFLSSVEGPLWTAVRGTGLAYGASFARDADCGFVNFSVYRSPDAFRAFAAAKKILEEYISGEKKFEKSSLEGAISDIVVSIVNNAATMAAAGQVKFVNSVMRGLEDDYDSEMLKKVRAVTVEEIKRVMKDVLLPSFTPGKSNVVVTCAPIMEKGIVEGFQSLGYKTEVKTLKDFEDDYGLAAEFPELLEGENEDEDDEEDEEEDEDEETGSEDESDEDSDTEMKN
ncbi:peptidase m16 inactive domain-containing protein [Rutstroemia sp. NJR-2017a WRK4]|nr:peptidase m16 inactive domain-containing protein [Rutstroemia sp. NJR-2017a WRK4]